MEGLQFTFVILILLSVVAYVTGSDNQSFSGAGIFDCKRDCPPRFVCGRQSFVVKTPWRKCVADVAAQITARLDEWNDQWNARNFQNLEEFYTTDTLLLPPGAPIIRGKDGIAEFIQGLVAANNFGQGRWTVDSVSYVTEEYVTSVDLFEIQSTIGGQTIRGKDVILWKKIDGLYLFQYEALNFDM